MSSVHGQFWLQNLAVERHWLLLRLVGEVLRVVVVSCVVVVAQLLLAHSVLTVIVGEGKDFWKVFGEKGGILFKKKIVKIVVGNFFLEKRTFPSARTTSGVTKVLNIRAHLLLINCDSV